MKKLLVAICFVLLLSTSGYAQEITGEEILEKADALMNAFKDMSFAMEIEVENANGDQKQREMRIWQKGNQRLIKFTKPASDRGLSFLAMDHINSYVYLPAYKKVRRIAAHVRNQTFMGTDFSYEDMSTTYYSSEYNATITAQNPTYWILELTPNAGSKTSYGMLHLHINKQNSVVEQINYFDGNRELIKTEKRTNIKSFNNKYLTPTDVTLKNIKDNNTTSTHMFDIKYDQNISDELFHQRNLKRPIR